LKPKDSFDFALSNIYKLLDKYQIEEGEDMNKTLKTSTVHSYTYILWEGGVAFLEKVIQGTSQCKIKDTIHHPII
jgi:hypothetical protein